MRSQRSNTYSQPGATRDHQSAAPARASRQRLVQPDGRGLGRRSSFRAEILLWRRPGGRYHVLLYSAADGKLQAMIESDILGQMRTGAASGLATKLLAKPDARTLGVIGAGRQAFTQVAAVCAVRPIKTVRVFTRTPEHREAFARRSNASFTSRQKPRHPARPLSAMPTSSSPSPNRRSRSCGRTGSIWRSRQCGGRQLRSAAKSMPRPCCAQRCAPPIRWRRRRGSRRVSRSRRRRTPAMARHRRAWRSRDRQSPGRRGPADITLFKSLGIALEDIAFADLICRRAKEKRIGKPMP